MSLPEFFASQKWISPKVYCFIINLRNRLRGKKHTVYPFRNQLYLVDDNFKRLYICRRSRHGRSSFGVVNGLESLAGQYGLNDLKGLSGGTFVDCGANVGELGLWAKSRGMKYIAFEPESLEADCCDLNNFNGESCTQRVALWNSSATLEFYTKPDTADSSLISLGSGSATKKIRAVRLDSILGENDLRQRPAIFKLEAEGAEPEVLEGAGKLLLNFDYIAIDCGPERGEEKRHTFVETNIFLADLGFRPISANFKRVTILYKNTKSIAN
ncbi:MAG: FkbM family methyltransferase [Verrucomicrobia bacterium]|nr:FkbM family methyltransferase [Verrucomicrobiota bacterium]